MSRGDTVRLVGADQRALACELVMRAEVGSVVGIRPPGRTLDQNSKLWALLSDVKRARPDGRIHTEEVWKCLFMQALGYELEYVPGLAGEPFPLGFRSSRLTKRQMSDLIEVVYEYGARHGVRWSEPVPA